MMDLREDLRSMMPFLPLEFQSSSLMWPSRVVEAIKSTSKGPDHSRIDSGEILCLAISDMRNSLFLSSEYLAPSASEGYALFFDELISREESTRWFVEVVPSLANLLLSLPSLLEKHYQNADNLLGGGKKGIKTGLRLLGPQEGGFVFLSQELIGALLACSFFCLFPVTNRGAKHLPTINFDHLFAYVVTSQTILCIYDYNEPLGAVVSQYVVVSTLEALLPLRPVIKHHELELHIVSNYWILDAATNEK